ncbi:MAG: enoyl-CoA hydratase/isomerase family protein [Moraxellaceae bacterium]|nr:enoyl-CoA hydratase/isomerase family protein [Moraxellaceae bacterium]MDP1775702.1 enoyl-CoA hydratase/isomerase family protein [Moraxellaceae bacterium]
MTDTSVLALDTLTTASGHLIAVATLDAERSLNALNLAMVDALSDALEAWEADERVVAVLLRGRGERAFCAGGDVRQLTEFARSGQGDAAYAGEFFAREYRLDYRIHRYTKPLLVWGTGVVMGGGMGLFSGAQFRVVTETTRMAMPEISIGLFPDVGGSYFLSRLPGRIGLFLGLSACHFKAADAMWLGLATHAINSGSWQQLLDVLSAQAWSNRTADNSEVLTQAINTLAPLPLTAGPLQQQQADIEAWCSAGSLVELDQRWREQTADSELLQKAQQVYAAGSPTSAALIWRQWSESGQMSLADVFRQEWLISTQCAQHPDFAEGVRALLIDKDQTPRWQPALLSGVSPEWVDGYYQMPSGVSAHPLADLA